MQIIIAAAVDQEIAGIRDLLKNPASFNAGGRRIFSGKLSGIHTRVVATGPGLSNTVQALTALVERERPSLILQTGCAGVFRGSDLSIGDVGIASREIDIHLGIEPKDADSPVLPLPFPILEGNIRGSYPVCEGLVRSAQGVITLPLSEKGIKTATGPFLTVATITATDKRAEALFSHYRPVMEAMEGAGAAHVCSHYGIPFLEIRAASNFVGKRERSRWNLPLSFTSITHAVGLFMDNFDFERLGEPYIFEII